MFQVIKSHHSSEKGLKNDRSNKAAISIGSNIEPEKNVREAILQITKFHDVLAESKRRWTKPVGYSDQPDFLNCAIAIATSMSHRQLRTWLKILEKQMGRIKNGNRYGPRTIDLDIVIWNGRVIDTDVYRREYLRASVAEVWPDF